MAATLTKESAELDQRLRALRAEQDGIAEQKQREARAAAQRQAELAQQEVERTLDAIDLAPYDAQVWQALDALDAAARALTAASAQREQAKASAVETISRYRDNTRVRVGPVNTLDGRRLESNRKFEITEICRAIGPVVKAIGGAAEQPTSTALINRGHRAGNRLPRQEGQ